MITRADCLSVALMLDARDTELCIALAQAHPIAALDCMRREVSEIRRLRRLFDAVTGRCLDFSSPATIPVAHSSFA